MKIGLIIYGSLDTLSGGYLYDRRLVEFLRAQGDTVEITSLPWRNYAAHLTDNFHFRLPPNLDILIEDELNHPSLLGANGVHHSYPVVSLVHHLRCSEHRPAWQNAFYRLIEKRYLHSVDGLILNSRTTKRVVEGLLGQPKPSIVAYPPSDRFGEAISEQGIVERAQHEPLRVLFLGNVIERKGLHTLIEAVRELPEKVRLDVVGSLEFEPRYASEMRKIVERYGLSSVVHFHGSLAEKHLAGMLRSAHVLAVPSSYEGFGIVYLEGMGLGLPAIGTTAGAASEIISDGRDGFLIPPEAANALANQLISLATDRKLLVNLSLAARQRYLRQPAWQETAANIRAFLFEMMIKH